MLNPKLQLIARHLSRRRDLPAGVTSLSLLRCLSTQTSSTSRKQSYRHHIGSQPLVYRNVGEELQRTAFDYASTEAIVSCHEGRRHTFRALLDVVDRVAAGLLKMGLQRGDYIGIWGPNTVQWYCTMLAAARSGLVSVGINPAFQAPELEYCLNKVNVKALVMPETYRRQNFYDILHSICPELSEGVDGRISSARLPHLRAVVVDSPSPTPPKGTMSYDRVLDYADRDEVRAVARQLPLICPDAPCNVQFTSGTTGQPKATVLSHYSFVNNGIHIGTHNQLAGQRICVQVPLFHAYGVVITIMAGLSHGATLVLPAPGFSPEASLRAIVNERCTVIHGTPTMYVDLIAKQKELRLPLTTARMAITGGAPCSPKLFMDIKQVLGLEEVRTVFGMTETTAVIFQSRPGDSQEQVLNTVGHLQDHVEAKVIDEQGNTVPFGQPGELCVRGYMTMMGYHGDEEKTKETMGWDKWLRTGDQFVLQEDGYGRIVGRLKEMIIRGGENIFPKEVEDFLNTHPDILETHVIGVADERMGEELCAFVRLRGGVASISRDQLKEFCHGKLAHFKVPRYVLPVDDFPKTTSGKIQKFKLKEIFSQAQKQPAAQA